MEKNVLVKGGFGLAGGYAFDQAWYPVTKLPVEEFKFGRTLCDLVEIGITGLLIALGLSKNKRDVTALGVGFGAGALLSTLKQLGKI